jgi:hypothetical protein
MKDLEVLIDELVEQRVNERLKEERIKLLQSYKDVIALKNDTLHIIDLLQPFFREEFANKILQLQMALCELQEYPLPFVNIDNGIKNGMAKLYLERKNLETLFAQLDELLNS